MTPATDMNEPQRHRVFHASVVRENVQWVHEPSLKTSKLLIKLVRVGTVQAFTFFLFCCAMDLNLQLTCRRERIRNHLRRCATSTGLRFLWRKLRCVPYSLFYGTVCHNTMYSSWSRADERCSYYSTHVRIVSPCTLDKLTPTPLGSVELAVEAFV